MKISFSGRKPVFSMHFAYSDGKLDFRCILRVLGEIIYFRWKTRFPMENSIFYTFCVFWVKLLISPSAGGSGDDQKCDTSFLGFSHERGWAGGGIPGASAQQTSASLCSIAEDFGFPESGDTLPGFGIHQNFARPGLPDCSVQQPVCAQPISCSVKVYDF